jgi:hypothetical protein
VILEQRDQRPACERKAARAQHVVMLATSRAPCIDCRIGYRDEADVR